MTLDLAAEPLVLHLADGVRVSPVALGADLIATQESLSPYLTMQLRSLRFGETLVVLDPATNPRILLAFPESADPDKVVGAEMGDREFDPMRVAKDELDTELEGRGELLKARKP